MKTTELSMDITAWVIYGYVHEVGTGIRGDYLLYSPYRLGVLWFPVPEYGAGHLMTPWEESNMADERDVNSSRVVEG